eukprot:Rhum_TRINITY_DN20898_c0_g1::Rhum_TRINITY_DN20898_c0_g1_i1::g.172236::m.172236
MRYRSYCTAPSAACAVACVKNGSSSAAVAAVSASDAAGSTARLSVASEPPPLTLPPLPRRVRIAGGRRRDEPFLAFALKACGGASSLGRACAGHSAAHSASAAATDAAAAATARRRARAAGSISLPTAAARCTHTRARSAASFRVAHAMPYRARHRPGCSCSACVKHRCAPSRSTRARYPKPRAECAFAIHTRNAAACRVRFSPASMFACASSMSDASLTPSHPPQATVSCGAACGNTPARPATDLPVMPCSPDIHTLRSCGLCGRASASAATQASSMPVRETCRACTPSTRRSAITRSSDACVSAGLPERERLLRPATGTPAASTAASSRPLSAASSRQFSAASSNPQSKSVTSRTAPRATCAPTYACSASVKPARCPTTSTHSPCRTRTPGWMPDSFRPAKPGTSSPAALTLTLALVHDVASEDGVVPPTLPSALDEAAGVLAEPPICFFFLLSRPVLGWVRGGGRLLPTGAPPDGDLPAEFHHSPTGGRLKRVFLLPIFFSFNEVQIL